MIEILGMKATEFTFTAFVYLAGAFFTFFVTKQAWPWFTKVRWPAMREAIRIKTDREFELKAAREKAEIELNMQRERQQYEMQQKSLDVQQGIRDNLIELKTLTSMNEKLIMNLTQTVSEDITTRIRNIELTITNGNGKVKENG